MATGAAGLILRCVFDGSLSMSYMNIERRPYHKNCKCALHKAKGECGYAASQQRNVHFQNESLEEAARFLHHLPV